MAIPNYSMATVPQFVGRSWAYRNGLRSVRTASISFATCTGDRQWIHVDVERARRESPFGATDRPWLPHLGAWSVRW